MSSQTSTQQSAAFDEIYARVPAAQVAWLKDFRRTHPYEQLIIEDTEWEYISCGQKGQTLLLLRRTGGRRVNVSVHQRF